MEQAKKKKKEKLAARARACTSPTTCFFCAMKEQDPSVRRAAISKCFREMPEMEEQEHVLVLSGLWNIAMAHPNDPEFPSLGIFPCMARLISRGLADRSWLLRHQNIYIPYYAAHIIGSYTINVPHFSAAAARSGVIPPLLDLLRGKLSWVEQRVAVRALGHLASYDATFDAVAAYEDDVVELAMHVASTCVDVVYAEFVGVRDRRKRVGYHCDLLTRGMGGLEMENRKAEEWASQLQCWSLHLLNCFACKERSLHRICREAFLKNLCNMWGGLVNDASPSGVGLLRILCHSKTGRKAIADCREVVESLCNLSRSSDDWQYMGIDCLLLLLKDSDTRPQVMETAAGHLADLVELADLGGRKRVGEAIAEALLLDFRDGKAAKGKKKQQKAVEIVWELKVERVKKEKCMGREEAEARWASAVSIKQVGNERFWGGEVEAAAASYSEALEVCPVRMRKERMVLYSNRAQCWLLLREAEKAASDATRALCLAAPPNSHRKSLWRRSQAYDMMGLGKESLMDCVVFVNGWLGLHDDDDEQPQQKKRSAGKVPYYAARMISKQMSATWLFGGAHRRRMVGVDDDDDRGHRIDGDDIDDEDMMKGRKVTNPAASIAGLSTIQEEPMTLKERVRKLERVTSTRRKLQGPPKSCLY